MSLFEMRASILAEIGDSFPVEGYDEMDWLEEYEYANSMWNEYTDEDIGFVLSVIRTCQGYTEKQIQSFIKEKYFPCDRMIRGEGVLCDANIWCGSWEYCGECMNDEVFGTFDDGVDITDEESIICCERLNMESNDRNVLLCV